MALSTYAELKTSVAAWLNREDLAANIPDFIRLAETTMNDEIRHWRMEKRATLTTGDRYVAIPTDWQETIRLTQDGDYKAMEQVSAAVMGDMRWQSDNAGGNPRFFRMADGSFELYPSPTAGTKLILEYFGKIPALSATNASNWVLSAAPDIYLYGALMHAHVFLIDDARVQQMAAIFTTGIKRLVDAGNKGQHASVGNRMRVPGMGGSSDRGYKQR